MKLKINPELQSYLAHADDWADACLERELLEDGEPRDSIVVWDETDEIVDGHRRYAICQKHNLKFSVVRKSFSNIEQVKQWMEVTQLERRNLDRSTSREIYERVMAIAAAIPVGATPGEARAARRSAVEEVAAQTGTTEQSVYRNIACEEVLGRFSGETQGWLSQQPMAVVARLKKLSNEEIESIVKSVQNGEHRTLADAVKDFFAPLRDDRKPETESLAPPQEVENQLPEVESDDDLDELDDEPVKEIDDEEDEGEEDSDFRPARPSPKPEMQLLQSAQKQLGFLIKAMDEFTFDRAFHHRLISKAREIGDLLERRKGDIT